MSRHKVYCPLMVSITIAVLCVAVDAQGRRAKVQVQTTRSHRAAFKTQEPTPMRERRLFLNGQDVTDKAAGLEVRPRKMIDGQWQLVDLAQETVAECDQFKVDFWSNVPGYVYFVSIDSQRTAVIYRKKIERNRDYTLPDKTTAPDKNDYDRDCAGKKPPGANNTASDNFMYFDDVVGEETLKLILTPKPIEELEQALAQIGQQKGQLDAQIFVSVASDPDGACVRGRGAKVKCRSVGFEAPQPAKNQGGFVISMADKSDKPNAPQGKVEQIIKENEAIVFDLRLRHVKRP